MNHILVVDDLRTFEFEADYARTSSEAITKMEQNRFGYREVWLDYDLGGDDTTLRVLDWIAEQTFNGAKLPYRFVLHTSNPVGRDTLRLVLKRWGYAVADVNAADYLLKLTGENNMSDARIVFVLDRTGSMSNIWDDALGGLNTFVKQHAEAEGKAELTLIAFDTASVDTVVSRAPAESVKEFTNSDIYPRAGTPLYDTIVKGVAEARDWDKEPFGGKRFFVVLTDGYENSSREANIDDAKKAIESLQDAGWEVSYLAANQDAWAVGSTLGYGAGQTMSYAASGQGIRAAFNSYSDATLASRVTGQSVSLPEEAPSNS